MEGLDDTAFTRKVDIEPKLKAELTKALHLGRAEEGTTLPHRVPFAADVDQIAFSFELCECFALARELG